MRGRFVSMLGLVVVLALVGAACGGGGGSGGGKTEGGGQITVGKDKANNHGSEDVSNKGSLELEADNDNGSYYFDPTVLTGTAGQKLTITVKNEGDTKHNFSIESQSINEDLDPGKEVTVTVTFPQSGSVEFFCEYHRSLGMAGELSTT